MIYFGISGRSGEAPAPDVELSSVPVSPAPAAVGCQWSRAASQSGAAQGVLEHPATAGDHDARPIDCGFRCRRAGRAGYRLRSTARRALERLLQAGEQRTIDAQREVVMRVGDASALSVRINGVEAKPLGGQGEVVTTRLNLTNFKDYLSTR